MRYLGRYGLIARCCRKSGYEAALANVYSKVSHNVFNLVEYILQPIVANSRSQLPTNYPDFRCENMGGLNVYNGIKKPTIHSVFVHAYSKIMNYRIINQRTDVRLINIRKSQVQLDVECFIKFNPYFMVEKSIRSVFLYRKTSVFSFRTAIRPV